jgi:hypothetical protein
MSSVNAGDQKQRFDDLCPDDKTQEEFVRDLLDAYEIVQDSTLDVPQVVGRIETTVASRCELAAKRGAMEALEDYQE